MGPVEISVACCMLQQKCGEIAPKYIKKILQCLSSPQGSPHDY